MTTIQFIFGGKELLDKAWANPARFAELEGLDASYQEPPYSVSPGTCGGTSAASSTRPFEKFAIQEHDSKVGLAVLGEKIIGIIAGKALIHGPDRYKDAYPAKQLPAGDYRVSHCIVHKDHRSHGIGSELYQRMREAVKASGYNQISVSTIDKTPDDHNLWVKRFKLSPLGKYQNSWVEVNSREMTAYTLNVFVDKLK